MRSNSKLRAGEKITNFSLFDQHNELFTLDQEKGRKILLSFHPLAWTKICARQMQSLENNWSKFTSLNCLLFGISVDAVPTKHAWAKELGIKHLRLLADFWPHGQVAQSMGLFREKDGFSERANVLLDEEGRIIWFKIYDIKQLPDVDEIMNCLQG